MHQNNNIISFPATQDQRLQSAIELVSTKDAKLAITELEKLVDDDVFEAYVFLGALYEFGGKELPTNFENARFYYEKSIEKFGAVEAYLGLARLYFLGKGGTQDYSESLKLYTKVAEENSNPIAFYMMGRIFQEGLGVEVDLVKSKALFEKAWEKGHVFSLTKIGIIEHQLGNRVRGWMLRLKAGLIAFRISGKNVNDPRLRER